MPKCSILGCVNKKSGNHQNISLHQLPKNDSKREKWLNIIGKDNLNCSIKKIYICSLHFDETNFNRTLNIITLRDNAMPSRLLLPPADTTSQILPEITEEQCLSPSPTTENLLDSPLVCDKKVPEPRMLKIFKEKCETQRKKIRNLNDRLRRQGKKIAIYKHIIKDLKEQNNKRCPGYRGPNLLQKGNKKTSLLGALKKRIVLKRALLLKLPDHVYI